MEDSHDWAQIVVAATGVLAMVTTWAQITRAQDYPSRDIHLVVGFPPGTGAEFSFDILAKSCDRWRGRPSSSKTNPVLTAISRPSTSRDEA